MTDVAFFTSHIKGASVIRRNTFLFFVFCLLPLVSCSRCGEQRAPVAEIKVVKEELKPILNASKELAAGLCERIRECGGKWNGGDCVTGMTRDVFSLVGFSKDQTDGLNMDQCRNAIKQYECSLILKYKFPEECKVIQ